MNISFSTVQIYDHTFICILHHMVLQNQASDTALPFTERAMLLGIAVKWFSNLPADQQQKTQEDLQELHKKRWLFKIRAETEKDVVVRLHDISDNLISNDHFWFVLLELNRIISLAK